MAKLIGRKEKTRLLRDALDERSIAKQVADVRERVVEHAASLPALVERLGGRRHRVLGADLHVEEPGVDLVHAVRHAEVAIYDYDRNVLVSAIVDLASGELVRISERPGQQPPPTSDEMREAAAIATRDPEVKRVLRGVKKYDAVAFVARQATTPQDPMYGRRALDVYFWSRGAKAKRIAGPILVDLSRPSEVAR
jgi:hypothetical protein